MRHSSLRFSAVGLALLTLAACGGSGASNGSGSDSRSSRGSDQSSSTSSSTSLGSSGGQDESGGSSSGPCHYMNGVTSQAYALHDSTDPNFPTAEVKSPDTCQYVKDGVILDLTVADGQAGYDAAPGTEFDSQPDLLPELHVDTIYKWDDASKTISQFAGGKSVVGVFGPASTSGTKENGMALVKFVVFAYKGSR